MKYVLDTCTYYWLVDDQKQLSSVALKEIGDSANSLHVSAVTLTELHRLIRRGKISIHAPEGLDNWFRKGLNQHLVKNFVLSLAAIGLTSSCLCAAPVDLSHARI